KHHDEEQVLLDMMSVLFEPGDFNTGEELIYKRPGLQNAVLRKLRRGAFKVSAVIDLHGMSVPTARSVLVKFLATARREHMTCVRVIHGKGNRSRHKGPVLKQKVNHWLRQRDAVLAFCSARPIDGGTGAVNILLKRVSDL
ncbi:MAG: Smr/MutS family protein, partial [Candidatus Competibacterales bacterium]